MKRLVLASAAAFAFVLAPHAQLRVTPLDMAQGHTALGLALLVPSTVSLAALILLCVAIRHQVIAVEEPYLRDMHGASYVVYCNATNRFLP